MVEQQFFKSTHHKVLSPTPFEDYIIRKFNIKAYLINYLNFVKF